MLGRWLRSAVGAVGLSSAGLVACSSAAPAAHTAGANATPAAAATPAEGPAAPTESTPNVAPPPEEKESGGRLRPLPAELREALASVRPDPAPASITRGRHYFISNENYHYLWREPIEGVGGIQIGVGGEQNYQYAGWARPEVLVLLDFDEWIVDLHRMYRLFFLHSKDADELVALWSWGKRKTVNQLFEERWPDRKERQRKVRVFEAAHAEVHARLRKLKERYHYRKIPSFLTDPQQFEHIKTLFEQDRVLMVRGDLTKDRAVSDVGAFAKKAKLPVRVLYLSNAEEYFDYAGNHFVENVRSLPMDERSVVLHSRSYYAYDYRFVYQGGPNFLAWISSGEVKNWKGLAKKATKVGDGEALRLIEAMPDGS